MELFSSREDGGSGAIKNACSPGNELGHHELSEVNVRARIFPTNKWLIQAVHHIAEQEESLSHMLKQTKQAPVLIKIGSFVQHQSDILHCSQRFVGRQVADPKVDQKLNAQPAS